MDRYFKSTGNRQHAITHTQGGGFCTRWQQSHVYVLHFFKRLLCIIAWPLIHMAEVTCSSSSLPVPAKLKELRCL